MTKEEFKKYMIDVENDDEIAVWEELPDTAFSSFRFESKFGPGVGYCCGGYVTLFCEGYNDGYPDTYETDDLEEFTLSAFEYYLNEQAPRLSPIRVTHISEAICPPRIDFFEA